MSTRHRLLLLLSVFALMAGLLSAALRICPSCGYEATGPETACTHCGGKLPPAADAAAPATGTKTDAPAPESVAPAAPAGPQAPAVLPPALVNSQIQTAREMYRQGQYWSSILFARNAAALASLQGADGVKAIVELETMIAECRQKLLATDVVCPACDGTGSQVMRSLNLKGELVEQNVVGGKCAVCKGQRVLEGRLSTDQIMRGESDARRAYDLEQRRRELVDTQGVWMPAGFSESLTARQIAELRKGYGAPCSACGGFRTMACETCKGAGLSKCTNEKCTQGIEVCSDCDGTGKSNKRSSYSGSGSRSSSGSNNTVRRRCESCNGSGKRPCQICEGLGYLKCAKCLGRGDTVCKKCKGTGQSEICTKCRGEGAIECTRCKGSGQYKTAKCPECKGEGRIVCRTCQGGGRVIKR